MKEIKIKRPWYSEKAGLFDKHYFYSYKDSLTKKITANQVNFLEKFLKLKKGMKILDLACGHGRHSIELARRGYDVTGQDINASFLKQAEQAARKSKVNVKFVKSDMRKIPFKEKFGAIINLFTSFGYFKNDKENQKVIREISRALKPGGKLLMDITNREWLLKNYLPKDWRQFPDGSIELNERSFNPKTGYNTEKRIKIFPGGKRKTYEISLRLYTIAELNKMYKSAGLILKKTFGGFHGERLTPDTKRCLLIAEKVNG